MKFGLKYFDKSVKNSDFGRLAESVKWFHEVLDLLKNEHLRRILIFANKSEKEGAMEPEFLAEELKLKVRRKKRKKKVNQRNTN
jgi:hypothetical protein